jgi:hypothetical protein
MAKRDRKMAPGLAIRDVRLPGQPAAAVIAIEPVALNAEEAPSLGVLSGFLRPRR